MKTSNVHDFSIRRATATDALTLFELITALAVYEKLPPPDTEAPERLARHMSGETPRFQAFIAELSGKPIGYAVAFETYSTFAAAGKYYLEDIFILPGYRGRGYGHALFAAVAGEAVLRGCQAMEWTALDWNKPAHDFYDGMGAARMPEWQIFRLGRAGMEKQAQENTDDFMA
jgi:GNAT superfamily N-acetyltransferase